MRTIALFMAGVCLAAAQPAPQHNNRNAIAWVRTSAEYGASARQTFAAAERSMHRALASKHWTAALEQAGDFFDKPPAVILDLDETVLDNGEYQERIMKESRSFDQASWTAWVREERAGLVPGALKFLTAARAAGVALFYASNRHCKPDDSEDPTARVLRKLNVPPGGLLCRGETGDKSPRRALVAEKHRVLLLVGDDLNDFITPPPDAAGREALSRVYANYWGERWFILPNPMYGSWERAK
jgi:acid phosphatase